VTLAGAWCDLTIWALAVLVWRITTVDSLINYLSWVVLSVCGARSFFNLNPLLKLDGYYLLSDVLEIPNLRQGAWDRFMGYARWLLWGADRPAPDPRGWLLLGFGIAAWAYLVFFLWVMLAAFSNYSYQSWGVIPTLTAAIFTIAMGGAIFQGISGGEVTQMFKHRPVRLAIWVTTLSVGGVLLFGGTLEQRSEGPFKLRPVTRAHVTAPTSGFLRDIAYRDGQRVERGCVLFQLEVPDLASRIDQKRAELRAAGYKLAGGAAASDSQYARLEAELAYLEQLQIKTRITCPISGTLVTPHLEEKLNTYVHEGDSICTLETLDQLEAEIDLDETYAADVRVGQPVQFKARAVPFGTFHGEVIRIAPAAAAGDVRSTVCISCRITDAHASLKPGMSGYARIYGQRRCAARVLSAKLLRYIRTEFWW
jgi:multidrug efflux pump subunit AcrA (membrane-fusion protein)